MRTNQEARLECLRMANVLATAKVIQPSAVEPTAESFFAFINKPTGSARDPADESAVDVSRLHERFTVR
jgi:hypothetical protein